MTQSESERMKMLADIVEISSRVLLPPLKVRLLFLDVFRYFIASKASKNWGWAKQVQSCTRHITCCTASGWGCLTIYRGEQTSCLAWMASRKVPEQVSVQFHWDKFGFAITYPVLCWQCTQTAGERTQTSCTSKAARKHVLVSICLIWGTCFMTRDNMTIWGAPDAKGACVTRGSSCTTGILGTREQSIWSCALRQNRLSHICVSTWTWSELSSIFPCTRLHVAGSCTDVDRLLGARALKACHLLHFQFRSAPATAATSSLRPFEFSSTFIFDSTNCGHTVNGMQYPWQNAHFYPSVALSLIHLRVQLYRCAWYIHWRYISVLRCREPYAGARIDHLSPGQRTSIAIDIEYVHDQEILQTQESVAPRDQKHHFKKKLLLRACQLSPEDWKKNRF